MSFTTEGLFYDEEMCLHVGQVKFGIKIQLWRHHRLADNW